jgi:hypothetical protein
VSPFPAAFRALAAVGIGIAAIAAFSPALAQDAAKGWVVVDYGALLDTRKLTHSGDPVGAVLGRLGGAPRPPLAERSEAALAHRLLDPIVEPYAFVLPDALDSIARPADPPFVEVGGLWEAGAAQPAWVEIVRARRFVLESDGEGRIRAILPARSLEATPFRDVPPSTDPVEAARDAWKDAWPVLRHALAGERLRRPSDLAVSIYAYRHAPERSKFLLGTVPWTTTVTETAPAPGTEPLDVRALQAILDRRQRIEGGRIEAGGRIRWFASEAEHAPTIVGRPTTLADVAVAYRSIAHGGYGEPYMSLDRADVPHVAVVNYGGRLRDTALGMVSLLADVRFKTFSVGIDLLGAGDVRTDVRRALPGFRTHLERFATDPTAGAVLNQQTRLWFRPDDVDLTLSPEQDVFAFRRASMTAVSERVRDAAEAAAAEPPWTKATTGFINAHYGELAALFPEMTELNETVRWLSVFAWLESARSQGLRVPDLDVLMAVELPAFPTPRRFPQLLSHDVLPRPGGEGPVDLLNRTDLGAALDRLDPADGRSLPPAVRFQRARAMLDASLDDQASLAREMDGATASADAATLDLLSFRAERLLMHARILSTLSEAERKAVAGRLSREPEARVFSIGIGGVDLGTSAILARAVGRSSKTGLRAAGRREAASTDAPAVGTAPSPPPEHAPAVAWPAHGLGEPKERATTPLAEDRGAIVSRSRPGSLVRKGTWKPAGGAATTWEEWVSGLDGTEPRARRRIGRDGAATVFERFEDGRLLAYTLVRSGTSLRATAAARDLPDEAFGRTGPADATAAAVPAGLAILDVASSGTGTPVTIRVRSADGRDRSADIPSSLLQRLVVGRAFDPSPARPLPAFTPAPSLLGDARTLMVVAGPEEIREPWRAQGAPLPGERSASRLAGALTRWWSSDPASNGAVAVVGVSFPRSISRWEKAAVYDGGVALVAPDDALAGLPPAARSSLASFPSAAPTSRVIVVLSAEAPGVLGRRLRGIATAPDSAGKVVAVVALGGPVRADMPGALLAEGRLGAIGVFEAGPVGIPDAVDRVAAWARQAAEPASKGKRLEELAGPFTWFY